MSGRASTRRYHHTHRVLVLEERARVLKMFREGATITQIAASVNRHYNTIWRFINRHKRATAQEQP